MVGFASRVSVRKFAASRVGRKPVVGLLLSCVEAAAVSGAPKHLVLRYEREGNVVERTGGEDGLSFNYVLGHLRAAGFLPHEGFIVVRGEFPASVPAVFCALAFDGRVWLRECPSTDKGVGPGTASACGKSDHKSHGRYEV